MDQNLRKRLLSLLLILTMLFTMLPTVYAAEEGDAAEEIGVEEMLADSEEAALPDEGTEPAESVDPSDTELPAEGGEPADTDLPAEGGAPEEEPVPVEDGDPPVEPAVEEAEEVEPEDLEEPEEEEDGDASEDALILVTFVSDQALTLTVSGEQGVSAPASEEEIAALLPEAQDAADAGEEPAFRAAYLLAPGSYVYTAEAEGFVTLTGALELAEDSARGETVVLTLEEQTKLPYGFAGMPEGYLFSADELAGKQALADHNVPAAVAGLRPGVDYIADEVYFLADSQEYAALVAEAYSAELLSCEWGVAELRLTTATALEAVTAAADPALPLPAVSVKQLIAVEPNYGGTRDASGDLSIASGENVPARGSWQTWMEGARNPDPYLADPSLNEYQYMHDLVNTYEAWKVTKGAGVVVGVIDTGVADHADLNPNVLSRDYIAGSSPYEDHGTHVAGIIAAVEDNGKGGAGIAPEAKIRSYCVFENDYYTSASLVRAINKAASDNVDIISMSLGGLTYDWGEEQALRNAINTKGITVVVAMGNDATNIKAYPAAYNLAGLIAVGSMTESGARSAFSNYGSWEDVAAPGSAIMSSVPSGYGDYGSGTNSYAFMSGTSMATPVVSGVCALYLSQFPGARPAQVEAAVRAATTNGIVDAARLFSNESSYSAVNETSAPSVSVSGLTNGTVPYSATITFEGILDGDVIVYSLNGKDPAVKDGVVTNGSMLTLNSSLKATLKATEANGFTAGKKVTVKAARVNAVGTMSKVASLTFTVDYAAATSVVISNAPKNLVAGKSVTLQASVRPAQANQKVTWSLDSAPDGVTLDASKGVLKAPAGAAGQAVVRAAAANGKTVTAAISIGTVNPVKSITLEVPSMVFEFGSGYSSCLTGTNRITPTALDAGGAVVSQVAYTFTSGNTKVATVAADGTVSPVGKGKAVITVRAQDGSNAAVKCNVEVKQVVESVSISGISYIMPGKKATYKASVLPDSASSKSVTWTVDAKAQGLGISVSSKGELSVPSAVAYGTSFTLAAQANDSRHAVCSFTVRVRPLTTYIDGIYLDDAAFTGGGFSLNKNSTLRQIDLYTLDIQRHDSDGDSVTGHDARAKLTVYTDAPSLVWTSSNPAVATVDQSGLVSAVAPGKATITAAAPDASGRKVSTTVQVGIPASGVTVTSASPYSDDGYKLLAAGKSAKNTAKLADAYGKPSISKVKWSYDVYVRNPSGSRCVSTENTIRAKKLVSINGSGTLTTKAALKTYVFKGYDIWIDVYAHTTDNTGLSGSVEYYLFMPLNKITLATPEGNYYGKPSQKATLSAQGTDGEVYSDNYADFYILSWFKMGKVNYYVEDWTFVDYTVKSSNPDVAGAYIMYDSNGYTLVEVIAGRKSGTAKITVAAADGSGKSATITVRVK